MYKCCAQRNEQFAPYCHFSLVIREHITMLKLASCPLHIGQGHPSSILTTTLMRYIRDISLGSMRLVFIELLCLQEKIANCHVEIDPHDLKT